MIAFRRRYDYSRLVITVIDRSGLGIMKHSIMEKSTECEKGLIAWIRTRYDSHRSACSCLRNDVPKLFSIARLP